MSRKICCPSCASHVTKKCRVIYSMSFSTTYGPEYSTTRVTAHAGKTAPPWPPEPPSESHQESFGMFFSGIGVLLVGIGLLGKIGLGGFLLGSALLGLGIWLWRDGYRPTGYREQQEQVYQSRLAQYYADLVLYERLWMCLDCEKIFERQLP